ncbi:tRNA-modifying protein YgfZ [Buchnera aphidicola (Protaphis terricola)]|uniref:tRNA-modifying protein YgfZ n=1 Tax=Buchnera aphidicola TaxID=9 RepID=UPI0034642835
MSLFCFSENLVYSSSQLPLTLISLEEWSIFYVDGIDSKKFLQNQLTIDMNKLEKKKYKICASCNLNGKVYSTMLLFHYRKGYACIIRKSLFNLQIKIFKKYTIFLKVTIHYLEDIYLLGLSGKNSRLFLSNKFLEAPFDSTPVIYKKDTTILYFNIPCERFLLVLNLRNFLFLKQKINKNILLNNSKQWISLDMESGFPIINKKTSQKFLPQAINLDKLQGISFNKGCYYGQEIITQVFYKNTNKYRLFLLYSDGKIQPEIGEIIETKISNKWFRVGFILSIVHVFHNITWIQAVLKKSIDFENYFKVNGFKNIFLIKN